MKPLNGERTHPLTKHAREVLRGLRDAPVPRQQVNPGVADRLLRGELVEEQMLPSPYKTRRGLVAFLAITPAGLAEIDR